MTAKAKARAQSAWWRAVRTFLVSFLGYLSLNVVGLWDIATWKGAAGAGVAALLTVALRYLDYTSVPTPPPG